MQLKDRVALVTGAGRGIGRAIALAYAREGARLALAARSLGELEEAAQEATDLGAETLVVQADVADRSQVDDMVQRTVERFSTIDILVNNAGIHGPTGPLHTNDVSGWIRTFEVNTFGLYYCCRAVIPVMLGQNRGKIINVSGGTRRNASAYGASKAAVVNLTEILAIELADANIQVNCLSPGSVHTRMWENTRDEALAIGDTELYESGRRVTSGGGAPLEGAADLAVFLASDASGDLSGRVISAVRDDLSALASRIPQIMESEAGLMRRVEVG